MTRFFITIESSLDLCEYAMKNMLGGEIFVCDMGSLSIKDLAIRFQRKYNSSNQIKIIGIKPGEKNYEELYTDQESLRTIKLDNYYVILPDSIYLQETYKEWINKKNIKKVEENIALSSTQSTKILNPDDLINNL